MSKDKLYVYMGGQMSIAPIPEIEQELWAALEITTLTISTLLSRYGVDARPYLDSIGYVIKD